METYHKLEEQDIKDILAEYFNIPSRDVILYTLPEYVGYGINEQLTQKICAKVKTIPSIKKN